MSNSSMKWQGLKAVCSSSLSSSTYLHPGSDYVCKILQSLKAQFYEATPSANSALFLHHDNIPLCVGVQISGVCLLCASIALIASTSKIKILWTLGKILWTFQDLKKYMPLLYSSAYTLEKGFMSVSNVADDLGKELTLLFTRESTLENGLLSVANVEKPLCPN